MNDMAHQPEHNLEAVVDIEDRQKWLRILEDRFGIPCETFDPYEIIRQNSKSIHIVSRDHQPPTTPRPDIVGMPLMRTKMKHPKITTAAAMAFGADATRNVVRVSRNQADAYLQRETFVAEPRETKSCTGRGYVLVAHLDVILGVGFYAPENGGGGEVRCMYPKAWALEEGRSAFDSIIE